MRMLGLVVALITSACIGLSASPTGRSSRRLKLREAGDSGEVEPCLLLGGLKMAFRSASARLVCRSWIDKSVGGCSCNGSVVADCSIGPDTDRLVPPFVASPRFFRRKLPLLDIQLVGEERFSEDDRCGGLDGVASGDPFEV